MNKLKYLLVGAVIIGLIAALVAWQRKVLVAALPPRIVCKDMADAWAKAGPTAYPVLGTGSMAPYIPPASEGKAPLSTVVAYVKPTSKKFGDIKKGDLVSYRTKWANGYVLHQAVELTSAGWIMSGLHNKQSETWEPITEKEFGAIIGEVYVW